MARRLSSVVFVAINVALIFVSLFMIGKAVVELPRNKLTPCEIILKKQLLVSATVLMAFSMVAVVGGHYRIFCVMQMYLFTMFLFIIALIALLIFSAVATGTKAPGSGEGYSRDTIRFILNGCSFHKIKNCLLDQGLCKQTKTPQALDDIEPACCLPPTECGYIKWNATYWAPPAQWPAEALKKPRCENKIDCELYQNKENVRCLDCLVCKQKIIEHYQKPGRKFVMLFAAFVVFIIFNYTLGWFVRNDVGQEHVQKNSNAGCRRI